MERSVIQYKHCLNSHSDSQDMNRVFYSLASLHYETVKQSAALDDQGIITHMAICLRLLTELKVGDADCCINRL
jgi:hypothetical protein